MGPSHPSTHGVLRVVLQLDGETIVKATPYIGYLHRGMEKIAENKTYHQFIPYTDRFDYLAPLSNNVGYALAVEKLLGIDIPPRGQYLRVMICELSRIAAHLIFIGVMAADVGAATVFFLSFQQREYLYDIFEKLSGARFTNSYTRIGGVARDIPDGWIEMVRRFLSTFPRELDDYERLLTRNRIWMERTQNVGVITGEEAKNYGLTGPNLRGSGIEWDIRKAFPYSGYENFDFEIPAGTVGDCYDRYLVRMEEIRQSVRIVEQAIKNLPDGPVNAPEPKIFLPPKQGVLTKMEELIHHFILITESFDAPDGEIYSSIEAPKGELGFYIISTGGKSPYRLRIRSPSFNNLQALPRMLEGRLYSDAVATIASLDPVLGEVDR
ncbi:MAG: NADH dehydrogenase (quinone) subunit D [Acidobacteriota bacterium]